MELEPEQKGIENGENTERDGLEQRKKEPVEQAVPEIIVTRPDTQLERGPHVQFVFVCRGRRFLPGQGLRILVDDHAPPFLSPDAGFVPFSGCLPHETARFSAIASRNMSSIWETQWSMSYARPCSA